MINRRLLLAGLASACATEPPMPTDTVFELRNYLLRPGQRDVLIALFEREFVESQEAVGSHVVGTFRNLDDPDRFVWIRSFADFASRYAALEAFYTGPVWQAHRSAANATMIDSDNVLLLRPLSGALLTGRVARAPVGAAAAPSSLIVADTYFLAPGAEEEFATMFADEVAPRTRDAGGQILATFVSEHTANNFPRLPVREDVNVFVSITRFASAAAHAAGGPAIGGDIARRITQRIETLRLQPTARSLLR